MATVWKKTRLTVFNCNPSDISKCMNYRVFFKTCSSSSKQKSKKDSVEYKKDYFGESMCYYSYSVSWFNGETWCS